MSAPLDVFYTFGQLTAALELFFPTASSSIVLVYGGHLFNVPQSGNPSMSH